MQSCISEGVIDGKEERVRNVNQPRAFDDWDLQGLMHKVKESME